MPRDSRFWRNVILIAFAHLAGFVALARWGGASERPKARDIVWLDAASDRDTASAIDSATPSDESLSTPVATPEEPGADKPSEESSPTMAVESEIELPTPTPSLTPVPTPATTPKPASTPKSTATPSSKSKPKPTLKRELKAKMKELAAKASPTPASKLTRKRNTTSPASSNANNNKLSAAEAAKKQGSGENGPRSGGTGRATGSGGGGARASEFAWYGSMLHDRFYSAWVQPTSAVPSGAKIATLVKIRIEKDGHVSAFTIVTPSGNIVVDESVSEVAKHVTQVDAPPRGIAGGRDHYDVNINFEVAN